MVSPDRTMAKPRENPLTVRLSRAEKAVLARVAEQVNCSRNYFVRSAAMNLAAELQAEKLVEV